MEGVANSSNNLVRPQFIRSASQNSTRYTTNHCSGRRTSASTLVNRQFSTTLPKNDWQADWDGAAIAPSTTIPHPEDDSSTPADIMDMLRMGKQQEMKRVFSGYSVIAFGVLCQSSWEFVLLNNRQALQNGGSALLFWSFIWSLGGTLLVTASLAEMCSMCPTMGGQYHWVSEFASIRHQKFLSYLTGWFTTIGWQVGNTSGVLLAGSLIQTFITLYRPDNVGWAWQIIVLGLPCIVFLVLVNIYGGKAIMVLMNATFILHVATWVAVIVVMWVLAPHIPVERALMKLENNADWPSLALAVLVGQSNVNFNLSYTDSAVHMSEEVYDAGIAVPRALMRCACIGGITGLIMTVTFGFCLPSAVDAINDPTGYPFLYVMRLTAPKGVSVFFLAVLIILFIFTAVGFAAATARSTLAFARDGGLPFSPWIAKINKEHLAPINAVCVTAVVTILLSLIFLGSMTAFYGVLSLGQITQSAGYFLPISCILWRRIKYPNTLPRARWSLERQCGRLGAITINFFAMLYTINMMVWALPPSQLPMTAQNFNLAPALFVGLMIVMMLTYHFQARNVWVGPVVHTRTVPDWNMTQFRTGENLQFVTIPEELED